MESALVICFSAVLPATKQALDLARCRAPRLDELNTLSLHINPVVGLACQHRSRRKRRRRMQKRRMRRRRRRRRGRRRRRMVVVVAEVDCIQ
jgi:hypothetical protein